MAPALTSVLVPFLVCAPAAGQTRPAIDLAGRWRLSVPQQPVPYTVDVPGSWQSQVDELRGYTGRATYSREVTVPDSWRGKKVFVCFGAVDYYAEVYINGHKVGSHEGGYTPFEFDVQDYLQFGGTNEIRVEVIDPGPGAPVEGFAFEEIPHGKQSWYGNASGIWQGVRLEVRNPFYIEHIVADPDVDKSTARFRFELAGTGSLRISIEPPPGAPAVPGVTIAVDQGMDEIEWQTPIPEAPLWSPESPALYEVKGEIVVNGEVVDSLTSSFGMRKIEAKDGKILLNSQPVFLAGALDQDFYPHTEYGVPSDDYIRNQFLKAKHLGLNLLRCHIKVPDPRYLDWADRLGLLVWYEIPNWMKLTDESKRRGKQTLDEMLRRDHNHPSLVIVSIMNESWGIDMSVPDNQDWLAGMYEYAKSLEPGRLVVDNSACGGNFHVKTDIEDFHVYYQIPDRASDYRAWVKDFARHPDWTFAPGGPGRRRGFEPLVLSEFGNWGLPRISNLLECYGEQPWWFGTGRSAIRTPTQPLGVEDRFREWCLDRVFGDLDGLADAFQDQEWVSLKFQIEEMRRYPSIVGYIITEFTDLHWESNGLLDMCRNPKTFYDAMHTVQDPDIVFAQAPQTNYVEGQEVRSAVYVSHYSAADLSGSHITWRVTGTALRGEIALAPLERGSVREVGEIAFPAPEASVPRRLRLELFLVDGSGEERASNYQEFLVFPTADPGAPPDVLICAGLTEDIAAKVGDGANAVICIESPDQLPLIKGRLEAVDRAADGRWGNWCSSVMWFADSPAFDAVPVPRTADFSFESVIPRCVIDGIAPESYERDVLSGIFVGWVHSHAVVIAQMRHGKGKVIITTLPLVSASKNDPMARFMLASLAQYVDSGRCDPVLKVDLGVSRLDSTFAATGEEGGSTWSYTTEAPGAGWESPAFDDSTWKEGKSGFGRQGTPNARINTQWTSDDIWLRFEGEIAGDISDAVLRFYHDEDAEVYLNGKQILAARGYVTHYKNIRLGPDALSAFQKGRNVIAVHCRQTRGGQFVDLGVRYSVRE